MMGGKSLFFAVLFAICLYQPVGVSWADDGNSDQIMEIDGQQFGVVSASDDEINAATSIMDAPEDQQVVSYESLMNQMGWGNSGQEHRKNIFALVNELKNAIKQNLAVAQQNYKDAKERETSYANRMLGGATMAATGIGGMELAQGLAEQKADEAADRDMQAYMATFQCKIGNKGGKTYTGGTKGIETPGANQLIDLYQEYVNLAADLKQRKEDLGLRPGVESEVVLDKANMGLYSDEAMIEKRNGTYASIYRAATGNETDAEKLAAERDKSAKRVKTGAIVAGASVVGGIAGNLAINGGKQTLANRNEIESELLDTIQYELDECNIKIQEAKEMAAQQKSSAEYKTSSALQNFVKQIESLEYLTETKDIYKLVDHPICY